MVSAVIAGFLLVDVKIVRIGDNCRGYLVCLSCILGGGEIFKKGIEEIKGLIFALTCYCSVEYDYVQNV